MKRKVGGEGKGPAIRFHVRKANKGERKEHIDSENFLQNRMLQGLSLQQHKILSKYDSQVDFFGE